MCHRVEYVRYSELADAMEMRETTGRSRVVFEPGTAPEAYPGSSVPLLMPAGASFDVVELSWGFARPQDGKLVFNTRLDTALSQLHVGTGLWASAMQTGRCLVPVRAFFETSRSTRFRDPATGRERASQFRFAMPGHSVFLIAGIAQEGRFSLMTTEPNATVGAVHTRMPLVLAPGESSAWLAGDFDRLANRGGVPLTRSEAL